MVTKLVSYFIYMRIEKVHFYNTASFCNGINAIQAAMDNK
jgi:hypothetical protein